MSKKSKKRPMKRMCSHAEKCARTRPLPAFIAIVLSIAAFRIRSTFGFVFLFRTTNHALEVLTIKTKRTRIRIRPTTISGQQQQRGNVPRFLKYADGDSNDYNDDKGNVSINMNVEKNVPNLGDTSTIQFTVNPTNGDIRFKQSNNTKTSEKVKVKEKGVFRSIVPPSKRSNNIMSSTSSDINLSELSKRVKAADFLRQQQEKEKEQQLILPIRTKNRTKATTNNFVSKNKDKIQTKNKQTKYNSSNNSKKRLLSLKRRWRRLRPSQKFRLRLGITAFVIASFWNLIVVRGMGGIGSSISFIATSTTATVTAPNKYGILKLLRKWISSRGFQGLAAAGRTVAYFWAILVGYPRMLDKRSKSSRRKREEETLDRWRILLRTSSEEIVRLRSELSLLEKEIRVFRREILAIRAARINNMNDNNRDIIVEGNNDESKLIREVILQEMYQLTRLRDDTRALLTSSRKRWAEIYAKRPSFSNTASCQQQHVDPQQQLEFELDAAATLGFVVGDNDERLLLRNNRDIRDGDGNTSSTDNNNDILLSDF